VPAFGEFGHLGRWAKRVNGRRGQTGPVNKAEAVSRQPVFSRSAFACSPGIKSVGSPSHWRRASMRALFLVIDLALELYIWIVIAAAIFSWLVAFHVVNTRNQAIGMIGEFLYRITEPVLRPIRNFLPNLGGIDISPVVLFLIIIFIRYVIALYILPNVY
jgi:YggT family protein